MADPIAPPTFVDDVTPINAVTFNDLGVNVYGNAVSAAESAELAQQYAEQAGAPADDQVALLVSDDESATRGQLDARFVPPEISGPYGSRPAANAVRPGTVYSATDVLEQYRSDGTAWSAYGPGGAQVGYAERTTNQTGLGNTATAITGLSVTFVAGERPVELHFEVAIIPGGASSTWSSIARFVVDGINGAAVRVNDPSGQDSVLTRTMRLSGLTPGSTHTIAVHAYTTVATPTSTVFGSAANPSFVEVKTL